ncbi:MAG: GAF domain-containing sensor histidine kinase [Deltaproteobacteria bacterium]|nr:GAF domain-containing sensor histidine kinase [Deltaproteobacteria bacterium]
MRQASGPDDRSATELRATLAARNRQIAAVHAISRLLSSSLDLDDRLRDILTVSLDAVDAVAGTIFLHRAADASLVFRYVVGAKARELTGQSIPITTGLAGAVFRSGRSQITNRPHEAVEHDREVGRRIGFPSETILTVPLRHQAGTPVGVLQLLNKRQGDFDGDDLEVLEIVASVAAAAIETAQLARDAQAAAIAHAVGDLSHDIKNKVAPIVTGVQALRADLDAMFAALDPRAGTPAAAALVRQSYGETFDIVMDQVEAVQDHTRLIADALKGTITPPDLAPHDLAAVLAAQLEDLARVARRHAVRLVPDLAPVPRCRVDRFLVERAVYNLVDNAIPVTPHGTVTVRLAVRPEPRLPGGRCVEITIADAGHGMAPDVLARILRGEPKSTKPGGTGLGTRIVLNAVAAHRGIFEGESAPGAGTTFRMKLPLLLEEEPTGG